MIGKYEIIKNLGEGAFGDTYLAVDVVTRQKVAHNDTKHCPSRPL